MPKSESSKETASTVVHNPTDLANVRQPQDASQGDNPLAAGGADVKFRKGYAPGDVAKETLYERFDGQVQNSTDQRNDADGFRGTVLVQEGDTVTPAVARAIAAADSE